MRAELAAKVDEIKASLDLLRSHLDVDRARRRLDELNAMVEDPTLWDDPERAQKIMQERTTLEDGLGAMDRIRRDLDDNIELIELGEAEGDEGVIAEASSAMDALKAELARRELESLLSGEADSNDTYLEVHAGAGGTDSQDWAEMLLRMYTRWAERHGFKVELVDESQGEQAGLKSATVLVKGHNAYGWLKTEAGVHRLVRISPFDSNARRQTSFSSVDIYPVIDDRIVVEINESDVRVDTMRSGGAGGQHVNKTESAVRIRHLPSGIVVACQSERSQHKNRSTAMKMLKAKLYELELRKRQAEQQKLEDSKTDIGWGHQIRSYVLDQSRIKDLRTNYEVGDTQRVLDGDLDPFIEASLKQGVQ